MEMFLLLLAVCSGLGTSLLDAQIVEGKKRSVTIERIEDGVFHHDLHKRSPDEQMPLALHMRLKDREQEVHLQLRKVPIIDTSSLTSHGTVKHDVSSIQDAAVYIDRRLGASVVVRKRESDPNNFDLEGSLLLGGNEVFLEPSSQEKRDSENDANTHDVTPVELNIDYGDDDVVVPESE
ncbi:uncharacterized protein LOC121384990 [Gigantopelta aegis]|uniref:uncharacterized protein LOC121384990 n=1 Tax=Gigantopelta aegis TaxID=1735272 RepID=UPI001B88DCC1|nr:uncharacterized protein LOC121384990 [Gigantopelta aegis]